MENTEKKAKRNLRKMDIKINCLCILSVLMLIVLIFYGYNIYEIRKVQLQEENINEGYAEEDIETINEVRDFFLCYYDVQKYDGDFNYWGPSNAIVDKARELLRKYKQIKLDEDKVLMYSEVKRNIQITQEAFILDTEYNVDILSSYGEWIYSYTTIGTPYGTWAKIDRGIPEYKLFLFGTVMETIELNDNYRQVDMVDISEINSSQSYQLDTKYFLFEDYRRDVDDYYVYAIDENEWIPFKSIKDIAITDDYISFISSENVFSVYCIKHNTRNVVNVLEEDEKLTWIYEPVSVYIPGSMEDNSNLLEEIFEYHERCNQ